MEKTALIFFSYTAAKQSRVKSILANKSKNLDFSKTLINHTDQVLKKTGLQVFYFNEKNQVGLSFGERLSNAFETVFKLGYTKVISVGNDNAAIHKVDFHQLILEFKKFEVIIGPTQLGGAYLIGLRKEQFIKEEFEKLAWNSKDTFNNLKTVFSKSKLKLLPLHHELNTSKDVKQKVFIHLLLNDKILFYLAKLLALFTPKVTFRLLESNTKFELDCATKRGPPAPSFI